jgi:hypothetical protein
VRKVQRGSLDWTLIEEYAALLEAGDLLRELREE